MWALLLLGIWAISRFCWCFCWNWLNYCSSPKVEGPIKIWSDSIVAEGFSLRKCDWLVERAIFCFPEEDPGEQWGVSSWISVPVWGRVRISSEPPVNMWGQFSTSELFRLPGSWEENLASGQGSSRERSPVGFRYSELVFLDVSGIATEQVRTCGFRRNSSSFDRAPKIRDSVLVNFFESFLVTLPSISSESWEMYSWAISRSSVFCDWLLLVFSGVFLETAANFLLFLKSAMILREKFCQQWRLNWIFCFYNPK